MSWVKLAPPQAQKKSMISVTLSLSKSGKGTVILGIPSALAGTLGFDKFDAVSVLVGEGSEAGRVMVEPGTDFKIGRLKHCVTIRFPAPDGVRLHPATAQVPYERPAYDAPKGKESHPPHGFIIKLPPFLEPKSRPPAGAKPGSLRLNGVILEMGAKSLSLTKTEATVFARLMEDWGTCVRKEVLHEELYALEPDGGADPKIIDVMAHKLRKKLREKGFDLLIETHWGVGYELRRATE